MTIAEFIPWLLALHGAWVAAFCLAIAFSLTVFFATFVNAFAKESGYEIWCGIAVTVWMFFTVVCLGMLIITLRTGS